MKRLLILLMVTALVTATQAIVVDNFSFEQPGTEKIKGWNGENGDDIPGWASDGAAVDSGVESDWPGSTEGSWSGFIMAGDPSVYNLTGHVIEAGELILLEVDARDNYSAASSDLRLSLYYDDAGVRNLIHSFVAIGIPEAWDTYTMAVLFNDPLDPAIGNLIGVELQNVSTDDSWQGLDNVRLSVVPEPATLTLLGLGVLGFLRRRK